MLQFIDNGLVDEIIDGYSCTCGKCGHTSMKLGGHTQIELSAERFHRFNSICFASLKIAVNAFFKILSEFVDGGSFIQNQGFVAHPLYFTAKTIILFAVFH